VDPILPNLHDRSEADQIPQQALLASLWCGNPTAFAKLNPGEIVLDLGSLHTALGARVGLAG